MSMMEKNPFLGKVVEFHILQCFPVSCLNRDDVGAPKSAMIGGVPRARVSSQCWKRQVRMEMHKLGCDIASRTLLMYKKISDACIQAGATEEQAKKCAATVSTLFTKKLDDEQKTDALVFISDKETEAVVQLFKEKGFDDTAVDPKELTKALKKNICTAYDGLDIALFGRMVASNPDMDVEAACGFSHAISTHKVNSELDFFTALDDLKEEAGSGHMGSTEFNSATYYRYISLNLGQLYETLQGCEMEEAVNMFVKALYLAIPEARQHSQSGSSFWDFARIYVRKGQRLQVPFETPIRTTNGGYLEESEKELKAYLDKKEKLSGSLFGLIKKIDFGDDENVTIDTVLSTLANVIKEGERG